MINGTSDLSTWFLSRPGQSGSRRPTMTNNCVIGTNDWICEKSVESANSADPCDALRALADLLRRTSDQLVHSRKQKLEDRRLVRLSVAEDQIDSWRISLQRAARYRRGEKVLCVSRQQPYSAGRHYQGNSHGDVVRLVSRRDIDSRSLQVIVDDRTQYRSRMRHNHECFACQVLRTDR